MPFCPSWKIFQNACPQSAVDPLVDFDHLRLACCGLLVSSDDRAKGIEGVPPLHCCEVVELGHGPLCLSKEDEYIV